MTRGDVPEWAKKRACELANAAVSYSLPYRESNIGSYGHSAITVLARYIAQHEEPPVDPLLIEAEVIAGEWYSETPPHIDPLLDALRRGMELAKERQP